MVGHVGLLDLPNELLRHIKTLWRPFDLTANVCYHLLCDRTAACFDGDTEDDRFWKHLCRVNGLGMTSEEFVHSHSWRDVAYECARHAWACENPDCGMYRLEVNRSLMESAKTRWSSDWAYPNAIRRGPKPGLDFALGSNPIFGHIAFATLFKQQKPYVVDIPYLRHADQTVIQEVHPGTELHGHPIVSRSFAMFPPVATAATTDLVVGFRMTNAFGITVMDVMNSLKTVLGHPITMKEFRVLLDMVDVSENIFPESWPIHERVSAVELFRDWLKIVKTTELSFSRGHTTWNMDFAFAHRELPERPHYIHGLSSEDLDPDHM